jgi:hypothetical protein
MNRSMQTWTGLLGVMMLGVFLLSAQSCEGTDALCAANCADEGVADGNASITGSAAIDSFFRSVINFRTVAVGVTADIQAELDGIQGAFGLNDADVTKAGNLGAAIKAKLAGDFQAKLTVKAQAAKCEIDAKIAASVTAECQAKAKCDVDTGNASFECMGKCTVDASVEGKCEAEADIVCKVSAPDFMCMGSCDGTCTAQLMAAATCSGNCVGTCSGTCEGDTDAGASCNGNCTGMCTGKCELSGSAAVDCKGSCNGACTYKPGMASCDARARVECELKAEAKAECTGRCEGEFNPPKADCEASASCEASAKAEAKFQAKCTPPMVDIKFTTTATGAAKTQFDFAMAELKVRLPRLRAALAKAQLALDAAGELGEDGASAIQGTVAALGDSDLEASVKVRIVSCAPAQLRASADVVTDASGDLTATIKAGQEVAAAVGM